MGFFVPSMWVKANKWATQERSPSKWLQTNHRTRRHRRTRSSAIWRTRANTDRVHTCGCWRKHFLQIYDCSITFPAVPGIDWVHPRPSRAMISDYQCDLAQYRTNSA